MKKSKIITFVLIIVLAICTTISLTACEFGKHKEHTWATDWSSDNTYHWHKCTGCTEVKDKAEHK